MRCPGWGSGHLDSAGVSRTLRSRRPQYPLGSTRLSGVPLTEVGREQSRGWQDAGSWDGIRLKGHKAEQGEQLQLCSTRLPHTEHAASPAGQTEVGWEVARF